MSLKRARIGGLHARFGAIHARFQTVHARFAAPHARFQPVCARFGASMLDFSPTSLDSIRPAHNLQAQTRTGPHEPSPRSTPAGPATPPQLHVTPTLSSTSSLLLFPSSSLHQQKHFPSWQSLSATGRE